MAELGSVILEALNKNTLPTNSLQLADQLKHDHQKIIGAIKSLQGFPGVIEAVQESITQWVLTPEGKEIVTNGSHEYRVLQMIPAEGQRMDEIKVSYCVIVFFLGWSVCRPGVRGALLKCPKCSE